MAHAGFAIAMAYFICFPQFQKSPNRHHLPSHNPPLALPSYLPIGGTNCFYWASKLLHGTFWPGLTTLKSPAAAFESFSTAQPSACFAIVPPHRPYKLFLLGFETATWHVLARPFKTLKSPAAAFESLSTAQPSACFAKTVSLGLRNCYMARFGQALKVICFQFQNPPNRHHLPSHNPPLALPSHLPIGGTNCFYWASKLLHGTFWPGLKTFKSPVAAFESLSTAQPSACFAIVPPHRPFKLFLLGFETATWHVLGRP